MGLILGVVVLAGLGAYLFARSGRMDMATTAKPLPFEKTLAKTALRASIGNAANLKDPLPTDETILLGGVRVYRGNCELCHGLPGYPNTAVAQGEFPAPPQLFRGTKW